MNGHMIQTQKLQAQQIEKLEADNAALHEQLRESEGKLQKVYQFCESGRGEVQRILDEQPETKPQAEAVTNVLLGIEQYIDQMDGEEPAQQLAAAE